MLSFALWLERQASVEPATKALQDFASTNADRWPVNSQSIEDYRTAITSDTSCPSRDDLLTALGRLYERWCNQQRQTFLGQISEHWGSIALFIGGLIIAAGLAYGIFFNRSFFELMAQSDHARGLITFLFSFATIAIAVLVAVAVFWMDKSEVEARFAHAKDLISILVGVLGTVIGFYFGTASTCQPTPRGSAIMVTPYTMASSTTTISSANATFDENSAIVMRK